MRKGIYAVLAIFAGACMITAGCDDDDTTTPTGSGTGAGTTTTGTTTTGTATGGGTGTGSGSIDCDQLCGDLWTCAQAEPTLCPGLQGVSEDDFKNGTTTDGCIAGCEANPALAAVVNPADCTTTVSTLITLNPDFAASCAAGGGGGAGGGMGGAGGAGGN